MVSSESSQFFLPPNATATFRNLAGMDSNTPFNWVGDFANGTPELRVHFTYTVLTLDSFSRHTSYKALNTLHINNVINISLPARTSYRTQMVDGSVFSPFEEELTQLLNMQLVDVVNQKVQNYVFTLCKLVGVAYLDAVTPRNIIK